MKENKKIYLIEKLLKNIPGGKADFSRFLKISHTGLNAFFKIGDKTPRGIKKYTKAFNKYSGTEFTEKELFSLVDNK